MVVVVIEMVYIYYAAYQYNNLVLLGVNFTTPDITLLMDIMKTSLLSRLFTVTLDS